MVVNVDSGQTVEGMKHNIVDTARTALPVSYCCVWCKIACINI
jgi:hypothetical protein